ncbi:hypothetical protein GCM10009727_86080 [Actinomadura napierensis]|uniref:Uncharacterized protein n=1 Tax=Actinomadura napierensis TaxID=267854 RepID=A0ABN3AHD6_9ACTN
MHDRTNAPPFKATSSATNHAATAQRREPLSVMTTAQGPWAISDLDPERALADLGRRFPGVVMWFGEYTGRYWALARGLDGRQRLLEAVTPGELSRRLECLGPRTSQAHPYGSAPPSCAHPVSRSDAARMAAKACTQYPARRRPTYGQRRRATSMAQSRSGRC